MSARELETGIATLRFSRRLARGLLDAIPADDWLHAPVPGGNPAIWIGGHLAWEDDDILSHLDADRGSRLPTEWRARFAQGTRPATRAEDYPGHDEIRAALDTLRAELLEFLSGAGHRLADPLPDGVHAFARDLAALMPALACHEMVHVGQLTVIRKSLQLPPVFG